jgi:tetratricopeptide (TPR) repeat protein
MIAMTLRSAILLILIALPAVNAGAAEDTRPRKTVAPAQATTSTDFNRAIEQLNFARQLMRDKNYQGASAILEGIYESDPANKVAIAQLITCYDQLKYYAKAEEMVRRQIAEQSGNYYYRVKLAEFLIKQDRLEDGRSAYRDAVGLTKPENTGHFANIIRSMMLHSLADDAFTLIDSLRQVKADPVLFALERGTILEQKKKYGPAAEEFARLLEDTTSNGKSANNAEKKLISLLEFGESSEAAEKRLVSVLDETASPRLLSLLSSFYLKAYRFEQAFQYAVRQDSLEGHKGLTLLVFMHSCSERKLYDQTAKMARYIIDHSEYYNDCQTALRYFDSVITSYQAGMGYLSAKLARPYCLARLGETGQAAEAFSLMLKRHISEDMREEVEYNLALLDFFEKNFDSSRVALRRLMVDFPRGFYVNDALQLLTVIDQAEENEKLLYDYSNAVMFEYRRMPDSVDVKLKSIVDATDKALADIALFKLSTLCLKRADTSQALTYIDMMVVDYPESYYLPYAIKAKADVLVLNEKTLDEARVLYRGLLEQYPNYPFISEVRKLMRQLDEESKIG